MFRKHVLPLLIYVFYNLLKFTWRIRIVESASFRQALDAGRPMVYAHWHGDEICLIQLFSVYKTSAMVSTSKDGDLMDALVRRFGGRTSRGSSTRGGAGALKGIIRLGREGWNPSIAVDGPKGPLHKVKPGVFEISRVIDGAIFPLAADADRKKVFERSWNKTFLPKPFARVVLYWGDGIPAVARDADPHAPELAETLAQALTNAKQQARNLIAAP